MARFRDSVKRERHVGQFGNLGLHAEHTRCPLRHWCIGGPMYSMQTGHSSSPINPWFSNSSSSFIRLQLQLSETKMNASEWIIHDSGGSISKAQVVFLFHEMHLLE